MKTINSPQHCYIDTLVLTCNINEQMHAAMEAIIKVLNFYTEQTISFKT